MLNSLAQHKPCIITTTDGDSIPGVYGGVETRHGEWSVLVHQATQTLSIPMEAITPAIPDVIA